MSRNDELSVRRLWIGRQQIRVRYMTQAFDAFHRNSVQQQRLLNDEPHHAAKSPEKGATPTTSMTQNTGIAPPVGPDQDEFDKTGLLLWPASRVLTAFLADPCGARLCWPQFVTDELDDNCPASPRENYMDTANPRRSSEESTLNRGYDCPPAGRCRPNTTALELGAGTGICGIAASMMLGWSVILTDRRNDVVDNLRGNVRLNALEQKAQVRRLAWGGTSQGIPCDILEQAPFKVILASDTVYPGKPLSDTEAFFVMVADLLDPKDGVMLLAYTPRSPSLVTENLLRCAYRVGLRGQRLDGDWSFDDSAGSSGIAGGIGGGHDTNDVRCRPGCGPAHRESELFSSGHIVQLKEDEKGNNDDRTAENRSSGPSRHGNDSSPLVGVPGEKRLAAQRTTRGLCRPVLLEFRFSPDAMPVPVLENGVGDGPCTPELRWQSEWKQMFPDLSYKILTTADRSAIGFVDRGDEQRPGGGALTDSAGGPDFEAMCTSEELWEA